MLSIKKELKILNTFIMKKIIFTWVLLLFVGMGFSQRPEMVFVEGGSFYMGNQGDVGVLDNKPVNKKEISDFYMSKYEVTFDMFDKYCKATGHERANDGGYGREKNPVINVSWESALLYCNWLSMRFNYELVYDIVIDSSGMSIGAVNWDADGYRLPTEAEWEYVAKGGSKSAGFLFAGSDDLDEVAWYSKNSENTPHEVGTLKPNELGIYDILGNAYEWCWDYYDPAYYKKSPESDPRGPESGDDRVYRGGNFESKDGYVRDSKRFHLPQSFKTGLVGIRLVQNGNAEQK